MDHDLHKNNVLLANQYMEACINTNSVGQDRVNHITWSLIYIVSVNNTVTYYFRGIGHLWAIWMLYVVDYTRPLKSSLK